MTNETRQTNKSVGSITMVNLTGNEMEVWINSDRTSYTIPKMKRTSIDYTEKDLSPVEATDEKPNSITEDGIQGFKPETKVFLRAIEKRAGYFHNNNIGDDNDVNTVKIDINGKIKEYRFKIDGEGGRVLKNSAVMTFTRSSFTIAAPDGEVWHQEHVEPNKG